MLTTQKILIIGGYGKVGQSIAKYLSLNYQIIIAGRNYKKANSFAQELGNNAKPLELDIRQTEFDKSIFKDVSYAIMCLDISDTSFIKACIENKVNYVDITATYDIMQMVEGLRDLAITNGVYLVLSVGIAPGLTNLLVKKVISMFEKVQSVDINIMLGSGEKHGKAAVMWTLENMNSEFVINENGVQREVKSFRESKDTIFPNGNGKRKVYRFPFSDQMTLPQTQDIRSISTWICLDSKILTRTLSMFKSLYKYRLIRNLFVPLLPLIRFGSEDYVVKVDGVGTINNEEKLISGWIEGENEGKGTALVTASVVDLLFSSEIKAGVHHIDEILDLEHIMTRINEEISLHIKKRYSKIVITSNF